jgi:hypothetical protein
MVVLRIYDRLPVACLAVATSFEVQAKSSHKTDMVGRGVHT